MKLLEEITFEHDYYPDVEEVVYEDVPFRLFGKEWIAFITARGSKRVTRSETRLQPREVDYEESIDFDHVGTFNEDDTLPEWALERLSSRLAC